MGHVQSKVKEISFQTTSLTNTIQHRFSTFVTLAPSVNVHTLTYSINYTGDSHVSLLTH